MRLIDTDKLTPINAPIAGIVTGELTHYEKIVLWQSIKDAKTVTIIDHVLEILSRYRLRNYDGKTHKWNLRSEVKDGKRL